MSGWGQAKRFYKAVTVHTHDDGFGVALDGKPVNTPAGVPLVVPGHALAAAMVGEWEAQADNIDPSTMVLCKLAATSIDRVSERRDQVIAIAIKFAETDMLCYRAEEPPELVAQQSAEWQPILDWGRDHLGADMKVTQGVVPVNQPYGALSALTNAISELSDLELTAVSAAAAAMGSLMLALAMHNGKVTAESAGEIALLDERFQLENWGEEAEAMARHRAICQEIQDTARFLDLLTK